MACSTRFTALLICFLASPVIAEDARSIADKMRQAQIERWEGVNTYLVQQSVMGQTVHQFYERDITLDPEGNPVPGFRLVPFSEIERRRAEGSGFEWMGPDALNQMAEDYRRTGEGLASGIEDGLADAGLPRGLFSNPGSDPWATTDTRVMMGGMADFLDFAADARRSEGSDPVARVDDDYSTFLEQAQLVGKVDVAGKPALHLRADDLEHTSDAGDGKSMTIHTAALWVDAEAFVPLRFSLDGTMTAAGETRPITIERTNSDYRKVPGSKMYEPYRQVMRISGQLDPGQRKQMQEAQAKLAELEQQMATMPESQRSMIMGRMGPQLETMRSIASGGGLEVVTEIRHIAVNPAALPDAMKTGFGQAGSALPSSDTGMRPQTPASLPSTGAGEDPNALAAAQQACLESKIRAAEEAQQNKRGFGRLMSAMNKAASRFGIDEIGGITRDLYSATATAEDLSAAARDLGLTESDIESCRTPQ